MKLSYIIPGKGLRLLTAQVVKTGGSKPTIIYPEGTHPCTERGFLLYQRGPLLHLRVPTESQRRLRRFLRDYVRFSGGGVESTNFWMAPFR